MLLAPQQVYQFAVANPDVMKHFPRYCDCDALGTPPTIHKRSVSSTHRKPSVWPSGDHVTLDLAAPLVQALVAKDNSGDTRYLYGVTRIGEQQSAGWLYHLTDAPGSVRQLADDSGNVQLTRGYTPYGEPLWLNGTASSRYTFTGEDYDPTVGLVFLRARYMQPTLGIFLARDPWSGDVMRPGSMNGYLYVEGNPVSRVDPSGQEPKPKLPPGFNEYLAVNGYIEGVMFSKTAFFQSIEISGIEIVYDFVTHERMRFSYTGYWKEWCWMNTSPVDASFSIYAGWYGFKEEKIEKEYAGPFFNYGSNAFVWLPFMPKARMNEISSYLGVSGNCNQFCTASAKSLGWPGVDWNSPSTSCGATLGLGGGGGLSLVPVGFGTFFTNYKPDLSTRTHYTELSDMANDILLGWNAPSWATALLNPFRRYMIDNAATVIWNAQLAYFGE